MLPSPPEPPGTGGDLGHSGEFLLELVSIVPERHSSLAIEARLRSTRRDLRHYVTGAAHLNSLEGVRPTLQLAPGFGNQLPRLFTEPATTASNQYSPSMSKSHEKNKKDKKDNRSNKLPMDVYEAEVFRLQTELVKLQEWVRHTKSRVVVIFEGRDAAGKGGTIKRINEYLSPRVVRTVALPAPTERERGQWYYQRYITHLPAPGEIVLFDRSWYNRAGVEKVMGFCTPQEHSLFLRQTPIFEQMLLDDGVLLRKYWFSVSDAEQLRRFRSRMNDPVRQWKLSPMDLESVYRWEDYSRAKDEMMVHTDTPNSPWYVVDSDIKKHARINMISHLLSTIDYHEVERPIVELPEHPIETGTYQRPSRILSTYVPNHAAALVGDPEN